MNNIEIKLVLAIGITNHNPYFKAHKIRLKKVSLGKKGILVIIGSGIIDFGEIALWGITSKYLLYYIGMSEEKCEYYFLVGHKFVMSSW
ncbi:TPA: hypothetical protein ENS27_06255 [bacterium]|nr:hypothetical protein [bacterium]